jgi:hypothetical protein
MLIDHPEPIDLQATAPAKSSSKMQRLLRSAFKREDDDADRLSRSGSGSSSSVASSGRPPSRRRDRSSHESFELDGETAAFPCLLPSSRLLFIHAFEFEN